MEMTQTAQPNEIEYGPAAQLAIEACVVLGQAISDLPPGEIRQRLERHQGALAYRAAAMFRQSLNRKRFFEIVTGIN